MFERVGFNKQIHGIIIYFSENTNGRVRRTEMQQTIITNLWVDCVERRGELFLWHYGMPLPIEAGVVKCYGISATDVPAFLNSKSLKAAHFPICI